MGTVQVTNQSKIEEILFSRIVENEEVYITVGGDFLNPICKAHYIIPDEQQINLGVYEFKVLMKFSNIEEKNIESITIRMYKPACIFEAKVISFTNDYLLVKIPPAIEYDEKRAEPRNSISGTSLTFSPRGTTDHLTAQGVDLSASGICFETSLGNVTYISKVSVVRIVHNDIQYLAKVVYFKSSNVNKKRVLRVGAKFISKS
ncbi:MAG: hypothetical protein HOE90_20750 [Bacteriovoracaceae bacterium]|nr:hypothetical protein [Bacteriovoracaceae bacterium]